MRRTNLIYAAMAAFFILLPAVPSMAADYEALRSTMIEYQIKARGVTDPAVLKAMSTIPRHLLVPEMYKPYAYSDRPLPIGEGQTISQPYVVALMSEALMIKPGEKVLEIGTGSGYQAAVLAHMGANVYTIEIREGLSKSAQKALTKLGHKNIRYKVGDGYYGWEEHAPFDAIIITASANHIPPPLIRQLGKGGRLIIPLGPTVYAQTLTLATKRQDGKMEVTLMGGVAFVPMMGKVRE